jgi:hypothetical protein
MTAVIVIGRTFTTSMVYPLYRPLLESVPSEIPARERYIPLPGGAAVVCGRGAGGDVRG